ncbi:hypothetical protein NM688_g6619 [Phlebia brevispora]|uniref:Uncharacterized protein n=1 Tax=Phlebia brevispora TaxID=194682 RepID=A0ACC1SEI9_9APHY|nr:hypothetical protein NM688_g6619 [Phlebia brevispora]
MPPLGKLHQFLHHVKPKTRRKELDSIRDDREWLRQALYDSDEVLPRKQPCSSSQEMREVPEQETASPVPTPSYIVRISPTPPPEVIPESNLPEFLLPLTRSGPRIQACRADAASCAVLPPDTSPPRDPSINHEPTLEPVEPPKLILQTEPDEFGVFCRYYRHPPCNPDHAACSDDLVDSPDIELRVPATKAYEQPARAFRRALGKVAQAITDWFAPFLNPTVFRIMHWAYTNSHKKSHDEMNRMVHDVMRAPDFNAADLDAFEISREEKRLDSTLLCPEGLKAEGWRPVSVKIPLPKEQSCHASIEEVPTMTIEGIWAEIYNSQAMLDEDVKIHAQPRNPEDDPEVEYVVMPIVFYSDSTRLANFGTASLWPLYLWNYALSKYINSKQSNFAAHHVAYIPSLPDILQDIYQKVYGTAAMKDTLRFCKAELVHAVLLILLDPDFMHAYEHGLLVECADGFLRHIFPRIFAYSADYPEQALLVCIWFLARCLCPTCLGTKADAPDMGSVRDMRLRHNIREDSEDVQDLIARARSLIFFQGLSTHSKRIEDLLKPTSLLPTWSAFSLRLAPFGVNHYSLFKLDVMHGFELGVWKALFTHILRLLQYYGGTSLTTLNERFRNVPTFGRGTIRRFGSNVSEMKQFAAHNYENVLQCIIPCLEGLLPVPMEQIVFDMIWFLLIWHALAKLRLHTEATVHVFRGATTHLSRAIGGTRGGQATLTKKTKKLNLKMFKWHNLPHFPDQIALVGPTDIYSTQTGKSEHKRVKGWYGLINKNKHEGQIAMKQQRQKALMEIKQHDVVAIEAREEAERAKSADQQKTKHFRFQFGTTWEDVEDEELGKTRFDTHHHMADSQRIYEDIFRLSDSNSEDPALRNFVSDLKDHLLARIMCNDFNGEEHDFSDEQRAHVKIINDRIYRHQILCVNFTTYDMCRDQDTLNPRTHADFMVLNLGEDDLDERKSHPYWYGRICGIFHTFVQYTGPGYISKEKRRMEFLWVRWFGRDLKAPGGFATRRLHRLGFVDADEPGAFGFLDPSLIIRRVHLIPAFHHGRTQDLLGPSILRRELDKDEQEDWKYYYMDMFVDRDMIMRYLGGGIGHAFLHGIVDIIDVFCHFFKTDDLPNGAGGDDGAEMGDIEEADEAVYDMETGEWDNDKMEGDDENADTDEEDSEEPEDEESEPEGEEG